MIRYPIFRVINGNNVTCADENMWLIPFNESQEHVLTISFSQTVLIAGLRVWNYNKSPEDTYRGVSIQGPSPQELLIERVSSEEQIKRIRTWGHKSETVLLSVEKYVD